MAKTDPLSRAQELAALPVCAPSILIIAPDEIRRERVLDLILKPFVDPSDPLAVRRLRGTDLTVRTIDELRADLFSVSLFSPQRYFVVRDFERANAAVQKELGAMIEKIPAGTHLCVTAAELKVTHPLHKFFAREERCVELPALEGLELKKWVSKELKKAGFAEVGNGVIEAIIAVAEESPDIAFTVIERVALYLDGGRIEVSDVRGLFSAAPDPNEFALIDAVAQGNVARSEVLLSELCAEGKSPFVVLALLTRTFSNYLVIKRLLDSGRSPTDVRQLMGMTQWVFDKQLQGIRRYKTAHLARAIASLVRADAKLKNRSLGAEEVVSSVCQELRPATA